MPQTKSAKKKYRLLLCLTNLTIQYWISVHSRIFYLWWREMERQAWSMEVPVNLALTIRWSLNNSNVTSLVDSWHEIKKTNIKNGRGHSIPYISYDMFSSLINMLWQEKEVIDFPYHSYLKLHQDICYLHICYHPSSLTGIICSWEQRKR